ncbi:MAG: hypothetical protein ACHQ06_03360 [Candidatus Dormibacteria bacterium]|uniref:Uncharacterized protein n=1 Tax=Candidatus Amunia macphersoniae TaxID=3127014 RepID=A0A934KMS3_9BACT|nr:hypothetical protein [Candidatus Dormibacteraeota bacterium]HWF58633.1 hypothetical protein [Candidatus Dormibacteraeota bacterium]
MATKRPTVSIDDVVAAIETARDKVMSDEVKSLVKLGLPKNVANKMVAERYRQRNEGEEGEGEAPGAWPDMS